MAKPPMILGPRKVPYIPQKVMIFRKKRKLEFVTTGHLCIIAPFAYSLFSNRQDIGKAGGAEIQLSLLAQALSDKGMRVTIVVNDYGQDRLEKFNGVSLVKTQFRYFGGSNLHFFFDTIRLIAVLRLIDADYLVFKTPRALLFALGITKLLFGSRLVRILASDRDCEPQKENFISFLYFPFVNLLDTVIFQSESQKRAAMKNLGIQGFHIPNFAHQIQGYISDFKDIDVLWVGTSRNLKQPCIFLDLACEMKVNHFVMMMSLGGDNDLRDQIEKRSASIVNLKYVGHVPYEQTSSYFARAKLLVNTSNAEGFPNVFLQAWQTATPVVSLCIDPDGVIVKNGLGRVSGNFRTLVNDVAELLADDDQRQRLGSACKSYVNRIHGIKGVTEKYIEVFEQI